MSNITLKSISIQNFKGCKNRSISFSDSTTICGANATGKTTIIDAFLWLLFDKDSQGNGKFGIRPVDSTGKEIDNIEISVEAVLSVDGLETSFKKTQKQKWTKHRGSASPTYEGNVNSYEINGFPQSEKEYKAKIAEIISEDNFKLIADLRYFSNLEWKKKKELLLQLCGDITDEDVINHDPDKYLPVMDDIRTAGIEKSREKCKKALKELNKTQKELPVRIDEVSMQVRTVPDKDSLQEKAEELKKRVADLKEQYDRLNADASLPMLEKRKVEIDGKINSIVNKARQDVIQKRESLVTIYASKKSAWNEAGLAMQKVRMEIHSIKSRLDLMKEELARYGEMYKEASGRTFDNSATMCKVCGQILPRKRIEQITASFEQRKNQDMGDAIAKGREVRAKMEIQKQLLEQKEEEQKKCEQVCAVALEEMDNSKAAVDACPVEIDLTGNQEYEGLALELTNVKEAILHASGAEKELERIASESTEAERELHMVNKQIADVDAIASTNAEIQNRITELTDEQKDVGQRIALTEQKLILLEEFSIEKSEMLSKKITSCFEMTNFSLFNQQINGGITEECEITLKGVRYKDMNSGHRIVCAMDIIKTFSKKLGMTAPLFVDNAESVNDYNLPKMDGQLILLKVTDDPELKVVV